MMAVIAMDPALYADTIMDMTEDPRFEHIAVTGITEMDKISVYSLILENLNGVGLRYGHMVNPNMVVMSDDTLGEYLRELADSILEVTGAESADIEAEEFLDPLDAYCYGLGSTIEDESEAFRSASTGGTSHVDLQDLLSDFLQSALEDSINVLTGGYREIEGNILLL